MAVRGGDKFRAHLERIRSQLAQAQKLKVGYLDTAKYPDGTYVAQVAYWMEYGAKIDVAEHTQTIYRSIRKDGSFNKQGRFVKGKYSNFASDHIVPAHTIVIPPRPSFRKMIDDNKSDWGKVMAEQLRITNFDVNKSLKRLGIAIEGQLKSSVKAFSDPPNAKSTIRKKGFDKPLVDTGTMWRSVSSVVED